MSNKFKNVDLTHSKTSNGKEEEKETKFTVEIEEYEEFPSLLDTGSLTTRQLMEKVSEMFANVYKDFAGCFITPYPNGNGFDVKLYFCKPATEPTTGVAYAFTDAAPGHETSSKVMNVINGITQRPTAKMYYITDEGKEFLEKFFPGNGKIDWNRAVTEQVEQTGYSTCTYAVVSGLDIMKIIPEIYGPQDDEGNWYTYQINVCRPLASNPGMGMNQLLTMNRISIKTIKKLGNEIGVIPTSSIPMVRR